MQGGATQVMSVHIFEERQRCGCPRQAGTRRANGDPAKVTILGHSAGGLAVNMLAASPVTKGYDSLCRLWWQ